MELGTLMESLGVRGPVGAAGRVRVCDLTEDSRTVVPGSLFIARRGLKADGKAFVEAAVHAGAVAILTDDPTLQAVVPVVYAQDIARASALAAERFYGSPSARLALVGVTGTNGKTTTSYLAWQLLNRARRRCGLIGTVVVDDGVEVGPASMTTPPAIELSRSLSVMEEAGCQAASLEVSSHALDQKRADALRFKVGIFTNLTGDHLDYHKTMDAYAAAKARLFEMLPEDALAIVNADDPASARMVRDCQAPVLRCGMGPGEGARVTVLDMSMAGMRLRLDGPWGAVEVLTPLVGTYNAMNVLQAAAACHALGVPGAELEAGLAAVAAPPGRLERVSQPGEAFAVFVDYAHSDDSLRNVLLAAGRLIPGRGQGLAMEAAAGATSPKREGGRLWVVFGCGGDRDRTKRPRMGRAAAEAADIVVVTSDNPRTERPSDIIDEILTGVPAAMRGKVTVQADRARAIRHALEQMQPGDVVVIAGKGHETEQILPDGQGGTIRTHFDDREVARAVLEERRPPAPRARRTG